MHSYTTPAISVMPLESVDQAYLGWLLPKRSGRRHHVVQPAASRDASIRMPSVGTGAFDHPFSFDVLAAFGAADRAQSLRDNRAP